DVVAAQVAGTARGDVGFITSRGRLLRVSCLDLPVLPAAAGPVSLAGGSPVRELLGSGGDGQGGLARGERVVGLCSLAEGAPPLAVGTLGGVVKRVVPDKPRGDEWDVIALKPGDEVVGAAPADDAATLAFVTSDAQLLRFAASLVRAQGRAAGGMAGVRLAAGAEVVAFCVVERPEDAQLVTVAGSAGALPGTEAGAAKVTPLANYPAKGRATGGVRCQRFLRGQDRLIQAWAGPGPARACGSGGQPVELPPVDERRDASGTPLTAPVAAIG
ncbi:MAG: DNA topoisomerase IV, partial [Bifidobacteriaceae bacterium]|nr:DNA topoisomerase IV [Bifidobacteriaceae bacterium]